MSDLTRRLLSAATAAALLLAAAPAPAQAPLRGLPGRNLLDRFGLERVWSNQATIDVRSDVVRHLVADEEVVIVQSRFGLITVFDAQSGSKLWDGQLARDNQYSYPAVTNGSTLFIVIGTTVYARDKFDGDVLWSLRLPSVPSTSPTVDENRMYVGTLEGSVYAFDLDEIERLQREGRLAQYIYEATAWRYKTSGEIIAAPVADAKRVVFASKTGSLYSVTPNARDLAFQFETNVAASAPLDIVPAADGFDTIYYAAGDTNLYALRASNGTTRWLYVAGAPIREKPHPIGDGLYLVPVGAGMYSLAPDSGRVRWWVPSARQFVAATPTRVYATDEAGEIAVIDRADGALVGTLPLGNFPIRVPNERTDRIYAATTSGLVTCLREQGAELPIYHRYPDRRPILPLFGGEGVNGVTAPETPADPELAARVKTEIDAAVEELDRLLKAGDVDAYLERAIPPDVLAEARETGDIEKFKAGLDPRSIEIMTYTHQFIREATPTVAADGLSAVYDLSNQGRPLPIHFTKIGNVWYSGQRAEER